MLSGSAQYTNRLQEDNGYDISDYESIYPGLVLWMT